MDLSPRLFAAIPRMRTGRWSGTLVADTSSLPALAAALVRLGGRVTPVSHLDQIGDHRPDRVMVIDCGASGDSAAIMARLDAMPDPPRRRILLCPKARLHAFGTPDLACLHRQTVLRRPAGDIVLRLALEYVLDTSLSG